MQATFTNFIQRLSAAGVESPRLEARRLLEVALCCDSQAIYSSKILTKAEKSKAEALLARRLQGEPLDKIIGIKPFYKYDFKVSSAVLSPRPDTEILVEAAIALLQDKEAPQSPKILDLGTGSGCIVLSILADVSQASGTAVDTSSQALLIAKENAQNLGVTSRLAFLHADWNEAGFLAHFPQPFDMVVSNPPYIPSAEIATLDKEVRCYDPKAALDGGADGLRDYRRLAELMPSLLQDGGYLLLEVGEGQAEDVAKIFNLSGMQTSNILCDLAGTKRCVIMKK